MWKEPDLYISLLFAAILTLLVANPLPAQHGIPFELPPAKEIARIQTAVLTTNRGTLVFELFPRKAPWHVANLKYLADQNFYDGVKFHLFHPGYIIQGGSPKKGNPDAGPGYELPPEFSDEKHLRGTLGMARRPDIINRSRRSHGSQFHILLRDAPRMDGAFTVVGRVVKGMNILDQLRKNDTIKDFVVYLKPDPRAKVEK